MPLAWSSWIWHGHQAFGMIIMPLAWAPCIWHGYHAFGMVTKPPLLVLLARSARLTAVGLVCNFVFFLHFWRFFATLTLEFCNHQIGDHGITPDEKQMKSICIGCLPYQQRGLPQSSRKSSPLPQVSQIKNGNPNSQNLESFFDFFYHCFFFHLFSHPVNPLI